MPSQAPFDQAKHRRVPAGRRGAGQFTHNPVADDPPDGGMGLSEDADDRPIPRRRRVTNVDRLRTLGFKPDHTSSGGDTECDYWTRVTHDGAWVCMRLRRKGWNLAFFEGRTSSSLADPSGDRGVLTYQGWFKSCPKALDEFNRQMSRGSD